MHGVANEDCPVYELGFMVCIYEGSFCFMVIVVIRVTVSVTLS
jgi:hypothetical protein